MQNPSLQLAGYHTLDLIHQGTKSLVYRGQRIADQKPVILKVLRSEYPSFNELVQFRHQYTITHNLIVSGIVPALALEQYRNSLVLVMADTSSLSLADYLQNQTLTLKQCLQVGIKIAQILAQLYQHRIIHKDIKPANILIHPKTGEIQLIDFSIASLLPKETQTIQNPNILEGTLAYISPEQTGRMNRGIDYRTDFYSLGVTLYELLIGKLPFDTTDAMELVHCHIAKVPSELGNRQQAIGNREEIPGVVSDLVMKLMAKNAEDRYQSAWGIQKDLENCLDQLETIGKIELFEIGKQDICDRFIIPEKLYGRSLPVQQLLDAFNRVANTDSNSENISSEMMLVAGYSGVGKTAVVNVVHKPIVRQRGYFIKGKFDQFQRNIPLSAFVQALRDLMGQLLSENDTQLQQWKDNILAAVGENGQVIIEVIPELEKIIGQQPAVAELSGNAAQNRFNLLFQKFLQVFTTAYHPLVIFLDDLQWADSASLNLIKLLMSESDCQYLFLIGAYRDNEVSPAHPLMLTLDEIPKRCDPGEVSNSEGDASRTPKECAPRENQGIINTITLAPLGQDDLNQLVADTLHCSVQQALPLTQAVYRKTKGNPFFATQFLKALYEDGLIYFNRPTPLSSHSLKSSLHPPLTRGDRGGWGCRGVEAGNISSPQTQATPFNKGGCREVEAGWQCDLAQVKLAAVSEDVVEFVGKRLQKLDALTQDVLKLAACIGNEFDLETLAIVRQTSEVETATDLWLALKEGLILPTTEVYKFYTNDTQEIKSITESHVSAHYKFLHDRIQQASYSLIPEYYRKETHLKIGQLLFNYIPESEQEERTFEIVNQLNMGVDLINSTVEREQLAQLNLIAGRKALASTAYEAAFNYLMLGKTLLSSNSWKTQYELTLSLYESATKAAYLTGQFDLVETLAKIAQTHGNNLLDCTTLYEITIQAYQAKNKPLQALQVGQEFLKYLGIEFPQNVQSNDLEQGIQEIDNALAGRKIEALLNLPKMEDPNHIAALQILGGMMAPCFQAVPELYPLLVCKQIFLSIKFGNTDASVLAYGAYGFLLVTVIGEIESAYQYGQLALNLMEKLNAKTFEAKVLDFVPWGVKHCKDHIQESLPYFKQGYQSGLETGDLEFSGYCIAGYCLFSYTLGRELNSLAQEAAVYSQALKQTHQETARYWIDMYRQAMLNLMGNVQNPTILTGEAYDEQKTLSIHQKNNDTESMRCFYFQKILLSYLFYDYEHTLEYIGLVAPYIASKIGMPSVLIILMYDSLAHLGMYEKLPENVQKEILEKVANNQRRLHKWATSAPVNYQHKYNLIEAEKHRVLGNKLEAMELYDKAIAGAKENEYIQEEALAYELAAKFYLEWGKEKIAQAYMIEAYYCYSHWGAKAKNKDVEQRYPQLLAPILEQQKMSLNPLRTLAGLGNTNSLTNSTVSSNTTGISEALDFTSVMKASFALSGEIELDRLISQLMQVMMENAGATKGVLMLSQDSQLIVEAISTHSLTDNENITVTQTSMVVEESLEVPISVINLVKRNLETLNIDNVLTQAKLVADDYFMQHKPQSLLCLPLKNRGQFLGILYLENHWTIGAFTDERIEVLKLLCSQAAISLKNASLYQQSKLAIAEVQQAQLQLVQSEKMSALGKMMAGITHEINNPLGFISGNLSQAEEYLQDLMDYLKLYQEQFPNPGKAIEEKAEELEVDYLLEDLPEIITSMQTGVNRIKDISASMRIFSRSDTIHKVEFDLHEGIDSTLLILKHRLKASDKRSEINVIKNYSNLPPIWGFPGQLNQVFMNLIANGIDVFDENHNIENPQIIISTEITEDGKQVMIKIKDNGLGMTDEVQQKIFEHLFTTKPVGQGTGLGLSISRQIVEDKHSGTLKCHSQIGEGTEFMICLPVMAE